MDCLLLKMVDSVLFPQVKNVLKLPLKNPENRLYITNIRVQQFLKTLCSFCTSSVQERQIPSAIFSKWQPIYILGLSLSWILLTWGESVVVNYTLFPLLCVTFWIINELILLSSGSSKICPNFFTRKCPIDSFCFILLHCFPHF